MTRVRFSKAPKATIDKQSIVNGRIYISSDTKEFFCDTTNGERIKICDIEVLNDDKSRTSLLAPLNKFYYVLDTKKLWYYNNDWNQIGPSNNLVIKANGTQLCSYNGQSEITINITKSLVGLGNVPNVSTNDQTPTYTEASTLSKLTSGETLSTAFGKLSKAVSSIISHLSDKNNPHGVTKSTISLGNVTNDRQIKGLSSGTTDGHVVTFGSDGYTVKDSGFTIGKSVPSDAKFTDTNTWIALKGATASAAGTAGYAPAPSAGASNRYLRSDGTWAVPPDTNTTYTLGSFGITASAAEINYIKGVTSSIQTQLNNKAASSHTHSQYYDSSVSRNKNTVLAAPNGSNGAATFRALVAADIPTLTKSKISDFPSSMPASDVYSWAKASTKPSYSKSEVGLGNVDNTADANKSVKYAISAGSARSASSATNATNIDDGVIS